MRVSREEIAATAKERGCKVEDLLAQTFNKDPFNVGTPTHIKKAEWFVEIWKRNGSRFGVHVRGLHYFWLSQEDRCLYNGDPYENTQNHWQYMADAALYARILGIIPLDAVVDRRNPMPHDYTDYIPSDGPDYTSGGAIFYPPELKRGRFTIYDPEVEGYDYSTADQPYHIEVWAEKSTMNDILLPICRANETLYSANVGEASLSMVRDFLGRVDAAEKPAVLFYISDFDANGQNMPAQVSRKIEFFYEGEHRIRVKHLLLRPDQVQEYKLFPMPKVEGTGRGKGKVEKFKARYDVAGPTELDALESAHPGEIARLLQAAIEPYRDRDIAEQLEDLAQHAAQRVFYMQNTALESLQDEIQTYKVELEAAYERHRAVDQEFAELAERGQRLKQLVEDRLEEEVDVELPEREEPIVRDPDDGCLYDSDRDYWEQIEHYKAHQPNVDGWKPVSREDEAT